MLRRITAGCNPIRVHLVHRGSPDQWNTSCDQGPKSEKGSLNRRLRHSQSQFRPRRNGGFVHPETARTSDLPHGSRKQSSQGSPINRSRRRDLGRVWATAG